MSCAPNQPPMPSPLPGEIPDTAISTARIKACPNGHEVPPADSCAVSLGDMMVEMQRYMHCTMNAFEISKYQGSCGMLRVVNGAVEITGLSVLIDECLSCLEPQKICPGKDGDVLTTVGSSVVWAAAAGGGAIDCATLMPLLEKDAGCIEAGSGLKYVLGYDAASDRVKYYPAPGAGFIGSCSDLRTKIQTECFVQKTGAPEKMFGTVGGVADWYPYVAAGAAFIGDCAALKDKLGTCVTEGTGAPTKVLSKGPNGIEWLNPPAGGGGGAATTCAEMPALLKCPPDATPLEEATKILAYAADGTAKKFELIKPYHGEIRAAANGAPLKVQTLTNTFGLQDVIGLWGVVQESGQGAGSWFNPSTGRITIGRFGRYHIDWSVFARMVFAGGSSLLANAYSGLTVIRAANTYNGGTYQKEAAVFRGAQQNMYADGKQWDSSLGGGITMTLSPGDQLLIRVSMNNTSPGVTVTSAVLRDDNAAWFTVTQLPDEMMSMPN